MPGRLTVSRKEFLAALKAARPNADSETRRIDLAPNAGGDGLIGGWGDFDRLLSLKATL